MAAVTKNTEHSYPLPGVQIVNVTAAASGDTFQSKFGTVELVLGGLSATGANIAALACDKTSTAGEVDITWTGAGTNAVVTMMIFGR